MWQNGWLTARSGSERFVKVGDVRTSYSYQSMMGRFFVGRTDVFALPERQEGIVLFNNPEGSGRRVFIQAVSVTSNMGRRAIFWFDAVTGVGLKESRKVANAHRGAKEMPRLLVQHGFAPSVSVTAGIDVFERLLIGKQTLLLDQEGKYILEPGHNHSVWFPALAEADEIDVAAAWWEEPLR